MGIVEQYLLQLKTKKRRLRRAVAILTALSILVVAGVSWNLRMTGIALVNDACCGIEEHQHTEECATERVLICGYDEVLSEPEYPDEDLPPDEPTEGDAEAHIHSDECYKTEYACAYDEHIHSINCYSDTNADVECHAEWDAMFAAYPYTGDLHSDLAGIAKTQVGYAESTLNFKADEAGVRHGYTRYGEWYGSPYGDWSAMFVSFCLSYAGADLSEYPINSGANTMAGLWDAQGRYAQAGEYFPAVGDLVFFADNTVGIVAEVQSATMYVICGDVQDAVSGSLMPVSDSLIAGWGMIDKPVIDEPVIDEPIIDEPIIDEPIIDEPVIDEPVIDEPIIDEPVIDEPVIDEPVIDEPVIDEPIIDEPIIDEPVYEETVYFSTGDPYDISNGPVFVMSAKTRAPEETEQPEQQVQTDWQQYSLLKILFNSVMDDMLFAPAPSTATNLLAYITQNGGTLDYTLMTKDNDPIPKGSDGKYEVTANEGYKLLLTIDCENGIESGTYTLQLPEGLMYDGGTGSITLTDGTGAGNNVTVGTWNVSGKGLVTVEFNQEMDSLTDNYINATIGIHFPDANTQIEFDGDVIVTVNPPNEQANPTTVLKSGHKGSGEWEDPNKIYWTVYVTGGNGSNIVGNTLSDSVVFGAWSKPHRYTESDMQNGLYFGVSGDNDWHEWTVPYGDPNLTWTETGWSYIMPTTSPVKCKYCQSYINLGNDGWTYNVSYTSTPDPISQPGSYGYENVASIDDKTNRGWVSFMQGEKYGDIQKSGAFVSDASGGNFVWEIRATIPGRAANKTGDYFWYLMDYLYLYEKDYANRHNTHNAADLAEVTVEYNGATIKVPNLSDATENDLFAWHNEWSPIEGGVTYGRQIAILKRCDCTEDNCRFGGGSSCWHYSYTGDSGWTTSTEYCQCWTVEEDLTFTFVYKTDAAPLIDSYGGQGYILQNIVELFYKPDPDDNGVSVGNAVAAQTIPGLFKKDLTKEYKDHTASYRITVNEAKAVLTNGDPLIINDVMSNNMTYLSGTMVITTEDVNGNMGTLQPNVDYTVAYDGSGAEAHILQITILNPQPVMYILEYDTTLFKPESHEGSLTYTNYATITLWGDAIKTDTISKVATEFNMAAKTYTLKLHKTCALTKQALAGAVFGVYNADGGLMTTGVTDDEGYLIIETDLKQGIIFKEHELYYAQEHTPPAAYILDDKENWFIFCNSSADTCETCQQIMGDRVAVRIPQGQVGNMDLVNEPISYELPATGGSGITLYVLCGVVLTTAPLVYTIGMRRKRERRIRE